MSVKRIYVEKKAPYAVEAKQLLWEIRHILQIKTVTGLRLLNRYDVEGVERVFRAAGGCDVHGAAAWRKGGFRGGVPAGSV